MQYLLTQEELDKLDQTKEAFDKKVSEEVEKRLNDFRLGTNNILTRYLPDRFDPYRDVKVTRLVNDLKTLMQQTIKPAITNEPNKT